MNPEHYPRRILLCVAGLSPQIVTETLYALTVPGEPRFVPTEIRLLTTAEGAERARLTLLSEEPGWFHRLRQDYGLPEIRFTLDSLHIFRDAQGRLLRDIRSLADNEAIADAITAKVRELTADPDCAIHASIAGGRKTMGFYLGYALSLFGRPQDRLSHVLVSSPFESNQDFFYPTLQERVIYTADRQPLDTSDAEVTLADIPFVRLRDGLHEHLLAPGASFSAVVAQAQRNLAAPRLTLDAVHCRVRCGETELTLPPVDFACYAWLARRTLAGQPGVCRNGLEPQDTTDFLAEYTALYGELDPEPSRVRLALKNGMDADYFDGRLAGIRKALVRALGKIGAQPYLIHSDKRRPLSRYALLLKPGQIRFEAVVAAHNHSERTLNFS
ncbi:MAG: TIGR02584 family CRISPR-associated protein [Candidatus Competibacteraceae bacterium]|nr:MAG: TIGR02584 family CRISPR-associated protein [Candidatus Competibacteraceae bacterium]